MAHRYDLIVRNGTVHDGTGGPAKDADVGVIDGRIAAVGKIEGRGTEEVDAKGHLVTPGFVDIHTHYDGQAVWDTRTAPSAWHGVTTAVMGNCGVGFAPCRPTDREKLVELMEGVEDIPGPVMHEGLSWKWETFGEYFAALDARKRDIDLCALLPHAALRVYVMGDRAIRHEKASADDIGTMRSITRDAVKAGAFGFSTSRTISHKTLAGDYTPTLRANEDELLGIARGMQDAGSGFLELVSDWNEPDAKSEFAMLRRVVEKSGRTAVFSLTQRHEKERSESGKNCWAMPMRPRRQACRSGQWHRLAPSACCSASKAARTRSPARRPIRQSRRNRWPSASRSCRIRRSAPKCWRKIRLRAARSR
jgi:N-acyl-D-aspartate/D-glutamate deacylase